MYHHHSSRTGLLQHHLANLFHVCPVLLPIEKTRLTETICTALVERRLLPAGPAYLAHIRRAVHKLTFEEHDKHAEEESKRLADLNGNGVNGEDDLGVGDEEETEDLLTLDPKEWKVRSLLRFS